MALTFPNTALDPIEIFVVEDTTAQVVWRGLPAGTLGAVIDDREIVLGDSSRPGAAEIAELRPGSSIPIDMTIDGRIIAQHTIHTEPRLDDDELTRIATISDLHLGETGFGMIRRMRERPEPSEAYPMRCAKAAVREAIEWGAELLVIKGDITNGAEPEHWELFDELLASVSIPVIAIPGNHDVELGSRSIDAGTALSARGLFDAPVQVRDLDGVRLVAVDTTITGRGIGQLASQADELAAAIDVATPALVFMHHHLEDRMLPWFWPLGVSHTSGGPILDRLLGCNPDLLISSGHTHRTRARRHGSGVVTEVGSTKDFPGVWAGYVVHRSGVRQAVRRVADPDCIAWTDRTHCAVGGIWGRWAPGTMADRAVSHRWVRGLDATLIPARRATLVE